MAQLCTSQQRVFSMLTLDMLNKLPGSAPNKLLYTFPVISASITMNIDIIPMADCYIRASDDISVIDELDPTQRKNQLLDIAAWNSYEALNTILQFFKNSSVHQYIPAQITAHWVTAENKAQTQTLFIGMITQASLSAQMSRKSSQHLHIVLYNPAIMLMCQPIANYYYAPIDTTGKSLQNYQQTIAKTGINGRYSLQSLFNQQSISVITDMMDNYNLGIDINQSLSYNISNAVSAILKNTVSVTAQKLSNSMNTVLLSDYIDSDYKVRTQQAGDADKFDVRKFYQTMFNYIISGITGASLFTTVSKVLSSQAYALCLTPPTLVQQASGAYKLHILPSGIFFAGQSSIYQPSTSWATLRIAYDARTQVQSPDVLQVVIGDIYRNIFGSLPISADFIVQYPSPEQLAHNTSEQSISYIRQQVIQAPLWLNQQCKAMESADTNSMYNYVDTALDASYAPQAQIPSEADQIANAVKKLNAIKQQTQAYAKLLYVKLYNQSYSATVSTVLKLKQVSQLSQHIGQQVCLDINTVTTGQLTAYGQDKKQDALIGTLTGITLQYVAASSNNSSTFRTTATLTSLRRSSITFPELRQKDWIYQKKA